MEDSHYFLKTLGLESYISQNTLPKVEMENFELHSKIKSETEEGKSSEDGIKDEICSKQGGITDDVNQITDSVQADDFFSSLELQSSSKSSTNVLNLSFSNKVTGGVVTRSRSFSSTLHETNKLPAKITLNSKMKEQPKKVVKKKRSERVPLKKRMKTKGKRRKIQPRKKVCLDGKTGALPDSKKQTSNTLDESLPEKILTPEKTKDDDDLILFNNINSKKEVEEKALESKQTLSNELQNSTRRCTPEFFPMSSVLMSDDISEEKDVVDNLLVEDYNDSFLEEIDEFNYAPPRSHTGGKWKPGSLTIRTSPMLWQNQTWESILEDRNQDEERRPRADTLMDSPTESFNKYSVVPTGGKWKSSAPPATHTGGKWRPAAPPAGHTGGKWRPVTPPATHTGGKWKPSDFGHRSKNLVSPVETDHNWNDRGEPPPPTHTGGKWKPTFSHTNELWRAETTAKPETPSSSSHTSGKWGAGAGKSKVNRSTLDVIANCQSTSGKCLKTSGGIIQYYCSPCNRRLSSKKMYRKHIQSELHFKRVLQENELEFDSRSLKLFHGLFTQSGSRERGLGKRVIKKPEIFKDSLKGEKKSPILVKIKGKRVARGEIIRCEVCRVKIPCYQLGKHLVSYYHSRRIQLNDPEQQKLILDNIHAIVKQAPYQCGTCKFYCNSHTLFKKHWSLPVHEEIQSSSQRFWCVLCSFECETARSMGLHLDSNSHREVILAVNKSIPIVIRHKVIFNCEICLKEFRFNKELSQHKKIVHKMPDADTNKLLCPICEKNCKNVKSLQKHVLNLHRGDTKVPYFCTVCNEFFHTAAEAKIHRNSQYHKFKKLLSEGGNPEKLTLSRSCPYCKESLKNLEKLKTHLLERHPKYLPKCAKCGMVFALSQEVSRHVKNNECTFDNKKRKFYACDTCSFSTNVKSELLLHVALHNKKLKEEKKISCPLCGALFTQMSLSIHLRSHLKERTYQCSVCSKAFVRKDRYVSHLQVKHEKTKYVELHDVAENKGGDAKVEEKKEEEDKSEEVNTVNSKRKRRDTKTCKRRQICGDAKCKYIPKDPKDLKNHSLFHIGPQTYQCPDCPYSAKTNTIIKRHYMIHVDERSFPCQLCSFKARLKSHLKRHMRLHTGAKPYKCPHCSYTCNILENLRKHVLYTKIHPGKKLYECKMCSFGTNVSKDFKAHLSDNHKNDYKEAEANEVAGIYNKEEDSKKADGSASVKSKIVPHSSEREYPAAFKRKMDLITQKYSPIAPKPPPMTKKITNLKNTSNLVEDKRKILKMELEKLKNQIKPGEKKCLRSYPYPAEKELTAVLEDNAKNTKEGGASGDIFLVNVMPAVISGPEEPSDGAQQQKDVSSACILYENDLPAEELELYLVEDDDV